MKPNYSFLLKLLIAQCLALACASQGYDFFYLVQQWPGSYCDTTQGCCYPTTGKPASDFGIHGLWPNYDDGSYPSNCDSNNPFDLSQVSDLTSQMQVSWPSLACPSSDDTSFWTHEWDKHGTCSESVLDEHAYFQAALDLKAQANILQALENAGIQADGGLYSLTGIKNAIQDALGYEPWIEYRLGCRDQLFGIKISNGRGVLHSLHGAELDVVFQVRRSPGGLGISSVYRAYRTTQAIACSWSLAGHTGPIRLVSGYLGHTGYTELTSWWSFGSVVPRVGSMVRLKRAAAKQAQNYNEQSKQPSPIYTPKKRAGASTMADVALLRKHFNLDGASSSAGPQEDAEDPLEDEPVEEEVVEEEEAEHEEEDEEAEEELKATAEDAESDSSDDE
ncbi:Extracellular ribonuclease LE [Morella rubra]|uniref:Extracellular ribonuclease LE n=1 Tax=Morella rubra TaxID=262757 RepID=A0A6A1WPB5_9ROSI|nr:Extracellular ribonuclease LE [Morella rubra]